MLNRLRQMLIKEFLQVFRDKRALWVLVGPPIIQMLIFGYAATYEIRHVPTAVLDLDHSQESRELIARFSATPYFDVRSQLTDREQIREMIDRGQATVALRFIPDSRHLLRKGQTAPLQVIVDGTNSNTALIALGYVNQIAQGFASDYQRDAMQRSSPFLLARLPAVELEQRPWFNPDLSSRWFFVPGVIGSLLQVMVIVLTAFAVVREREIGTLEQIMVTPIRPARIHPGQDSAVLPHRPVRRRPDRPGRHAVVPGAVPRQPGGAGAGADAVPALRAGDRPVHLHGFRDPAAGHGHRLLLHHAGDYLFRIRVSHRQHAAVRAVADVCRSVALLAGGAARRVSEGRRPGHAVAADGGHGRAGNGAAGRQCAKVPKITRLGTQPAAIDNHLKSVTVALKPGASFSRR